MEIKAEYNELLFKESDPYFLNQTFFDMIRALEEKTGDRIVFKSYLVQIPQLQALGTGLKCVHCSKTNRNKVSDLYQRYYHCLPLDLNNLVDKKVYQEFYQHAERLPRYLIFE